MELATEVVWGKRLISAFGAFVFTLLLTTGLYTINDFRRDPNLQWFNGGESQIVVGLLVYGGLIALVGYVLFVPLVLLWPAESQRKHWYAMLCVAMLWPPLLTGGSIIGRLELFALCSCGCYLLLIHWQQGRLNARSRAAKILR